MRKSVFFLICLFFDFPNLGRCNETNDYMNHISEISPNLMSVSYQLDGGVNKEGINVSGTCDAGCNSLIKTIESGQFKFLVPVIYTNSAATFYKALVSETPCRDLGVLSYVDSVEGMGYSTEEPDLDFYRPTRGFAIYKLPYPNENILILRGEDYEDSGIKAIRKSSLDVNVNPADLPTNGYRIFGPPGDGAFFEFSSSNCVSKNVIFRIVKSYKINSNSNAETDEGNSWLSNPIIYRNEIYFCNVVMFYPIPQRRQSYTEYSLEIMKATPPLAPPLLFFFYK